MILLATTQYIGSRYVPLFGDPIEWSAEKAYEPLTVVTHLGNSYTSKQAVPVGIDIANEDFWVITGNYNAQVEQYRRETAAAKNTADLAQADVDSLGMSLPKNDFSAENTVKKYIDNSIDSIGKDIVAIQNSLYKISPHIDNATLIYRDVQFINQSYPTINYMQGGCVFPANNDWNTNAFYIAYVTNTGGLNIETQLHIISYNTGNEIGGVSLGTGHGGLVTYIDNKLIIPRYTNDTSSPKQLLVVDVTSPISPVITNQIPWTPVQNDVVAWFAYKGTTVLGYGTPNDVNNRFGIYSWDYTTANATWLFDLVNITKYGKRTQPPVYDSSHDCIVMPYADCSGFVMFDMNGNIIAHKSFESEIGFVTLGEIEWVCVNDTKVWFAGQHASGKGTILSSHVFEYDTEMGGFGFAPQGYGDLNVYTIRLNQNSGAKYPLDSAYSTNTNATLMVPEDALNMARYIKNTNDVRMFLTSDYDCCLSIHDYSGRFAFNNHFATRGVAFYAFTGLLYTQANFASVDETQFLNTLSVEKTALSFMTPDEKPVWCLFNNCDFTMSLTGNAYEHDDSYYKYRFIGCNVKVIGNSGKPLYDMLVDSSVVEFAYMQNIGYCRIGGSIIRNARILINTFDILNYKLEYQPTFDGCFIVDGTDTVKLLAKTPYYFGDVINSSLHGYNYQPLIGNGRRQSVCDRLHAVNIPFYNSGSSDNFIIEVDSTNKTVTFSNTLDNMTGLCMFG